jgi:hypothetical protein
MKYCKCGTVIPQGRVEFLIKAGLPMSCIAHSTTERVAGYNLRGHKGTGDLVVTSQETANQFYKASARTNGIVSQGVRFKK